MNKKLLCLVLCLSLVCGATAAFAATSSKTTSNTGSGVLGAADAEGTADAVLVELVNNSDAANAVLDAISAIVNGGSPVVSYFDDSVQNSIALLLPAGFDLDTLVMNEFATLKAFNYDATIGAVVVTLDFATQYADGANIVALAGVIDGDTTTWTALKAVVENGVVNVYFTPEILQAMQTNEVVLAILSEN